MTQGTLNQLATPVLAGLKGNYAQLWHIQMAGATLTSLPPLMIFVVLGRYFVSVLMAGALKKHGPLTGLASSPGRERSRRRVSNRHVSSRGSMAVAPLPTSN